MQFGNINITKEMMPSYQIMQEYPTRKYQFMQDTLNKALQTQAQLQNPQNGVQTQPVNNVNQQTQWGGQK